MVLGLGVSWFRGSGRGVVADSTRCGPPHSTLGHAEDPGLHASFAILLAAMRVYEPWSRLAIRALCRAYMGSLLNGYWASYKEFSP